MYGALPKIEKSFDLNVDGNITGHTYSGVFTVRCALNMQQKHQLEIEKTRLRFDTVNPTDRLDIIASALAELKIRIIEGPAWWKESMYGLEILDENVIADLYEKCLELENTWRQELKAKAEAAAGN